METRRFQIHSSGVIRTRKNTEISRYKWNIIVRVREDTSESTAEHFHIAWKPIFNEMNEKLGTSFCHRYSSRLRHDVFKAIREVSDAFYCVERATATFEVTTEEQHWEWGQPYEPMQMKIHIQLMSE